MIDLRYVERLEPIYDYDDGLVTGISSGKTVRVLQWRKFLDPNTNYQRWSEWMDVPTVKEPT